MNVLLSSAGRRSYLVEYFRNALRGRGQIIAANTIAGTAGMLAADIAVVVPPAKDPSFVESLLRLCRRHNVGLLFSLHDWEAPFLAPHKERFLDAGTRLVMPDPEIISTCLDKFKTCRFAEKLGIPTPKSFIDLARAETAVQEGKLSFPLILKHRWGQGSAGITTIHDLDELRLAFALMKRQLSRIHSGYPADESPDNPLLIQEFLHGTEYGVDIVNDLQGRFVTSFVKRKLAMRNGETDSAETVLSPELESYARTLASHTRHPGILDADFFITDKHEAFLLELNPRFGGGYPFSHMAGANIPAALLAWERGEEPDPAWLKVNIGVTTFKDIRLITNSLSGPSRGEFAQHLRTQEDNP
jgi:carbamoyl-phosphate synthase large subunit